jgi:thiol-disulfide isomerase/thioredoxin
MDKSKRRKELREWLVIIAVFMLLWLTGWYKDVAGFVQRGLLETGILQPEKIDSVLTADYGFWLLDADGQRYSFTNFRNKTVFVNLWATWCPPCIAEMPDIHDLYKKTGEEVQFVMISLDKDPALAFEFVERKGFDFPVYSLAGPLPEVFQSRSIPTTFVISPEGEVVVKQSGMAKYDTEAFRRFLLDLAEVKKAS